METNEKWNSLPKHIAMILDGNGRWAKGNNKPRSYGHYKGALNIPTIANEANRLKISYLTLFCFSTENWNRPQDEVSYLMGLPIKYFQKNMEKIEQSTIRIRFIGRRDRISKELVKVIQMVEMKTLTHTGLVLTIALDYGAKNDLSEALKKIKSLPDLEVTEDTIYSYLSTSYLPPVDFLIRTSGECRISNFLLLESAYAEFSFVDTYWPDFDVSQFHKALLDYQSRNRRFGRIEEK